MGNIVGNISPAMAFALVLIAGIILFALGGAWSIWRQRASPGGGPVPSNEEKEALIKQIAYDSFDDAFALFDASSLGKDKVIDEAVRITRERIMASTLDTIDKAFWDEPKIRRAYSWLAGLFEEKLPAPP